jgi:hypothetical protein
MQQMQRPVLLLWLLQQLVQQASWLTGVGQGGVT